MIIDTHVHYNLEPLDKEWNSHWMKARELGVTKSIVVGTESGSNQLALEIAEQESGLFVAVGFHPHIYSEIQQSEVENDLHQIEIMAMNKKVVAVGETGLDYYRLPSDHQKKESIIQLQKSAFEKQIDIAKKQQLPLILHVRDKETPEEVVEGNAYWDALTIMQKNDVKAFTLHCASGPLSYIKAAVEMGGYIGFDGNITYPNAQAIRDIFKSVPADRRLVETDAPFLPPQEFRGKICEPWMITKTVEYLKRELGAEPSSFAENAERLFHV
jgi:TatD DNase family protein